MNKISGPARVNAHGLKRLYYGKTVVILIVLLLLDTHIGESSKFPKS